MIISHFNYIIINTNFIEAPAVFIRCSTLKEICGYDEQYKLLEDWPAWYISHDGLDKYIEKRQNPLNRLRLSDFVCNFAMSVITLFI